VTLNEVLSQVGGETFREAMASRWEESVGSLPIGPLPFLEPDSIRISREWGGLAGETQSVLEDTARRVEASPLLRAVAWHAYRRLVEYPEGDGFGDWPELDALLGERSGAFYLLVALGIVPCMRAVHQSMGVSEDVTRNTAKQLWSFTENYRRGMHGRLGMYRRQLGWCRHYIAGRLFRFDRFEFKLEPFHRGGRVFRHRGTGDAIVLADDGQSFNADGHINNEDWASGPGSEWMATLRETPLEISGHPIAPEGRALRRQVRLRRAEWEWVTAPDLWTLDMHIPAGGDMTPERCLNSMRQAVEFFPRFFPGKPFRTISCSSWIFGPQLERVFDGTANLVRFMRELYLFPVRGRGENGLWFIFLRDHTDPATVARDTALRRKVAEYLEAGGRWYAGGMVFLTDDLDGYGTQRYRARWPEVMKLITG